MIWSLEGGAQESSRETEEVGYPRRWLGDPVGAKGREIKKIGEGQRSHGPNDYDDDAIKGQRSEFKG